MAASPASQKLPGQAIEPIDDDVQMLRRWSRSASVSHRLVLRSRIVLRLLDGQSQAAVARELQVSRDTVARWRRRFEDSGVAGLTADKVGRGRRPGRNAAHVALVLATLRTPPPSGEVRWTVRLLARCTGVSASTVQRIWREHAKGHRLTGQMLTQREPERPRRTGSHLASADDDVDGGSSARAPLAVSTGQSPRSRRLAPLSPCHQTRKH